MQSSHSIRPDVSVFRPPPAPGELIDVAPCIRWLRLPLPYRLDHVNVYLIENAGGWTALDTGLGTDACKQGWEAALAGPLKGQGLKSVVVSHFHPDHVGLAGWLCERYGLELTMPRPEYLHTPAAAIRARRLWRGGLPAVLQAARIIRRRDGNRAQPWPRIPETHHRRATFVLSDQNMATRSPSGRETSRS